MPRVLTRSRLLLASAAIGMLAIAGCSTGSSDQSQSTSGSRPTASPTMGPHGSPRPSSGMGHMGHMDGGPVPAGMKKAAHPKYPAGSKVLLTADHMPGMKGAHATAVAAYDTYTYAVTYTPTTGGPVVKNHKWVVQEEIKGAGNKRLPDGAKVVLTADHMPGMRGAHATIVSSTAQPVYVVDYTAGGKTMKDHKWVVQDEMKPAA